MTDQPNKSLIYVVIGSTGEYSDQRQWVECAYNNPALAHAHAQQAAHIASRPGHARGISACNTIYTVEKVSSCLGLPPNWGAP